MGVCCKDCMRAIIKLRTPKSRPRSKLLTQQDREFVQLIVAKSKPGENIHAVALRATGRFDWRKFPKKKLCSTTIAIAKEAMWAHARNRKLYARMTRGKR